MILLWGIKLYREDQTSRGNTANKSAQSLQERPGLVVLTIELEGALAQMPGSLSPSRMWSPYRQPLAKFLNKYSADVGISVWLILAQLCPTASCPTSHDPQRGF